MAISVRFQLLKVSELLLSFHSHFLQRLEVAGVVYINEPYLFFINLRKPSCR